MFHNLEEALRYIRENEVKFIDFKMVDLRGRWKHLTIPANTFNADTLQYGIGFDGSNYGYAEVKKSDMVFIPDLKAAALDPFTYEKTLVMIGDVMVIEEPENRPFDQYPRNVAKAALDYMRKTGAADEMIIGPEYEFHVFEMCAVRSVRIKSRMNSRMQSPTGPMTIRKTWDSIIPTTGDTMRIFREMRPTICAMKSS